MAIFANAILDTKVQIDDRFRIDAQKSFVSTGASALTTLTVQPGADGSPISVFNSDLELRFLDWEFDTFTMDINSSNNKIDFEETAGTQLTATLDSGTYTLSQLATEIKTQLDSAGALTYTVAYSVDDKITISAGSAFTLSVDKGTNRANSIVPNLGFPRDTESSASHVGDPTEYVNKQIDIVAGDGVSTDTRIFNVQVYSEAGDKLFSSDQDLINYESDIMKWLRDGRNSYKSMHRRAQTHIIEYFDRNGFEDLFGHKFDKHAFRDVSELREWSTFTTLRLIFESISNSVDDVFAQKVNKYSIKEQAARGRAIVRLDVNKDGVLNTGENTPMGSVFVARR